MKLDGRALRVMIYNVSVMNIIKLHNRVPMNIIFLLFFYFEVYSPPYGVKIKGFQN